MYISCHVLDRMKQATDLFENTQAVLCCEKKKIYKDVTHEPDMWLEKRALIVSFCKYLHFVTCKKPNSFTGITG